MMCCRIERLGAIVLCLFALTPFASRATVITVGSGGGFDYSSVQVAIDAAVSGDTVQVAAGTYVEGSAQYRGNNLSVGLLVALKNNISVVGAGSSSTFIDFNSAHYGLMIDAVSDVLIQGFSMWNGGSAYTSFNNTNQSGNQFVDILFGSGAMSNHYPAALTLTNVRQDQAFVGPTPTPEPTTVALLALSLIGIGYAQRRQVP